MKNVSNRVLIIILSVALVITFTSTLINLNKLGYLTGSSDLFTTSAVASSSGVSNLTVTSSTSITNNVASINFGSGTVNGSCSTCSMNTEVGKTSCCVSFTNISSGGFLLENTGNTNISVGYTCTGGAGGNSCNATSFIGPKANNKFLIFVIDALGNAAQGQSSETGADDTVKSCVGGTAGGGAAFDGWLVRDNQSNTTGGTFTAAVANRGWLCGNATSYPLQADNTKDAGVVHLNITIDGTETGSGNQRNVTFTFNATSSG